MGELNPGYLYLKKILPNVIVSLIKFYGEPYCNSIKEEKEEEKINQKRRSLSLVNGIEITFYKIYAEIGLPGRETRIIRRVSKNRIVATAMIDEFFVTSDGYDVYSWEIDSLIKVGTGIEFCDVCNDSHQNTWLTFERYKELSKKYPVCGYQNSDGYICGKNIPDKNGSNGRMLLCKTHGYLNSIDPYKQDYLLPWSMNGKLLFSLPRDGNDKIVSILKKRIGIVLYLQKCKITLFT